MKRILLLVIVAPYGAAKEKIKRYDSLCGSLWLAVARCGSPRCKLNLTTIAAAASV